MKNDKNCHVTPRRTLREFPFHHARRGDFYDDARTTRRRVTVRVREPPDACSVDDKDDDENDED